MNTPSIYPTGSLIANRYEVVQGPAEKRSLRGGMGLVYLCLDRQEDRPVALKTFQPQFLPDRAARDRFLREGTIWVDLGRHPHIVRCYNVERVGDGREVYLALELVAQEPGRPDASLRAWLTPGQPLPVEQALLFALQIVRGMEHACETLPGFVHRDLKPENVLVGADQLASLNTPRLRVTDFGLANILSGAEVTSQGSDEPDAPDPLSRTQLTHGIVGTPLYMAPEQWTGGQVGVYTDVYAFGCILFEMLTGLRAVQGRTLQVLEQAHCQGQFQTLPPTLPAAVRSLVAGCLHVEPKARYPTWNALETTLTETWSQLSGQELPPTEAPQELSREERVAVGWSYNHLGLSYLDLGKADVALGYFKQAQAVGVAEWDQRGEWAALSNLGSAYASLGDTKRAIGFYEQQLAITRAIGDRRGEGNALGNLGNAHSALGDSQRAIVFLEQALPIQRQIGDRHGEGNSLGYLGEAYRKLGDARRAIGFHEQVLEISRVLGDQRGEGVALGNLGNAYADLGDARQALGFYEQALVISRESGDRRMEGHSLGNLGATFFQLGDPRRALGFYEQQLEITHEIGDRKGEGIVLGNLGNVYHQLGDARRAFGFYEQQLAITREIGDRQGEGNALGNLGSAYASLGDTKRAIGFYEQHLAIARKIGDRKGEGIALGNLGNAHSALGDSQRAIVFLEQDLAIAREIGNRHGEGITLGNLGAMYEKLGDAGQALEFFEQALTMQRKVGDLMGVAVDAFNMALLYAEQGEAARALPLAQEAARIWSQMSNPYAQRALQLIARLQGSVAPGPAQSKPTQAAFEAFQRANSPSEMQTAVAQYPFMTEKGFIQVLAQFINEQVPPEHQPAFQQRLAWLKQLADKKQPGLLSRLFGKKR